jgi:hypothetical protein
LHLYEGLVKFGSVKAIMAVSSTTVLGQIARFFILLSDAPSYWFSPKEPDEDNGDDKITALAPPALEINNQPTMVTREDVTGDGGASEGGQGRGGRGRW